MKRIKILNRVSRDNSEKYWKHEETCPYVYIPIDFITDLDSLAIWV